jgi:hypothetical protein
LHPAVAARFLREVEGKSETGQLVHPGAPRKDTVLSRIRGFYGYAVSIHNNLYEKGIPRSFAWREFHELWQTIVYVGGTHASSGLLARLENIADVRGRRTGNREAGPNAVAYTTESGERVLEVGAHTPAQSYPWDRSDIDALASIGKRARFMATATDSDVEDRARKVWCGLADEWLSADPKTHGSAWFMLENLVAEAPSADESVLQRLDEIAKLSGIPESLRKKATQKASPSP